jgi:hypothetical protein
MSTAPDDRVHSLRIQPHFLRHDTLYEVFDTTTAILKELILYVNPDHLTPLFTNTSKTFLELILDQLWDWEADADKRTGVTRALGRVTNTRVGNHIEQILEGMADKLDEMFLRAEGWQSTE